MKVVKEISRVRRRIEIFSISIHRVNCMNDRFDPYLICHLVLLVQWQHGLDAVVTAGDTLVELIDRFPNEKSI